MAREYKWSLLRRSGVAVGLIADLLQWAPKTIVQVGVGTNPKEIEVFGEAWPDAELIGYEPHPQIYQSLTDRYRGRLYQMAIGDQVGMTTLYSRRHHKDGASVHALVPREEHETFMEFQVPLSTLDVLWPDAMPEQPILLWLDCEGSELAVLRGARRFLAHVDMVNVELTSRPLGDGWPRPVAVHDALHDAGFKRQWVHTQRSSHAQVDGIYVRPELFRPQFCCCPCEMRQCEPKSST